MGGWENERFYDPDPYDGPDLADGSRQTFRQLVVRAVALLLLCSFLGSLYLAFRGVEHIGIVIAILGIAALVGIAAKKQRQSENPYRSGEPPDMEIH